MSRRKVFHLDRSQSNSSDLGYQTTTTNVLLFNKLTQRSVLFQQARHVEVVIQDIQQPSPCVDELMCVLVLLRCVDVLSLLPSPELPTATKHTTAEIGNIN